MTDTNTNNTTTPLDDAAKVAAAEAVVAANAKAKEDADNLANAAAIKAASDKAKESIKTSVLSDLESLKPNTDPADERAKIEAEIGIQIRAELEKKESERAAKEQASKSQEAFNDLSGQLAALKAQMEANVNSSTEQHVKLNNPFKDKPKVSYDELMNDKEKYAEMQRLSMKLFQERRQN